MITAYFSTRDVPKMVTTEKSVSIIVVSHRGRPHNEQTETDHANHTLLASTQGRLVHGNANPHWMEVGDSPRPSGQPSQGSGVRRAGVCRMIEKQEAQAIIDILNSYFQVPPVALCWRKMRGGRYHSLHRAIAMGTLGDEATVVHEFAHHLDRMTNKRRYNMDATQRRWSSSRAWNGKQARQGRHDVPFRAALVKVATAWYGDPAKYPWHDDYSAVFKWWAERVTSNASQDSTLTGANSKDLSTKKENQ